MIESRLLRFPIRLTARDIARPIPPELRFDSNTRVRDYRERVEQALGWEVRDPYIHRYIVTLIESNIPSYHLWDAPGQRMYWEELAANEDGQEQDDRWLYEIVSVEHDVMVEMLIAGDTPLEEVLKLFTGNEPRVYFILTGREISHVVTPLELVSTPVRMVFFAKILELEDAIRDVLMRDAAIHVERLRSREPKHYHNLSRKAAERLGEQTPDPYSVIRGASLATKWRMLTRHGSFADAVPNVAPHQAIAFLEPVVRLRNAIAHGDVIQISDHAAWDKRNVFRLERDELYGLFVQITGLTDGLRRYVESK